MKNTVFKSALISLIVTTFLCVMNWVLTVVSHSCIGVGSPGGEYHATYGLGIRFEEFYPLTTVDDPAKYSCRTSFDIVTYLLTLVLIFFLCILIGKIRRKSQIRKGSVS